MTQIYQHVKFRWTENLTSRFICLRKENDKLFTGRKYSAQAGWEFILRQMKQEFPTIMADVPFRVLKKKWSNLLQQYKELKNPVIGDKNKADDVSWPFYNAIDEIVLGQDHHKSMKRENIEQPIGNIEEEEEEVDPHEFLCVSVTPPDEQISPSCSPIETNFFLQNHDQKYYDEDTPIQAQEELTRSRINEKFESTPTISVCKLTNTRKNTINESRMIHQKQLQIIQTTVNHAKRTREPPLNINHFKKMNKNQDDNNINNNNNNSIIINKINEFLDYTKKRDEENKLIMLKILSAVEKISEKLN